MPKRSPRSNPKRSVLERNVLDRRKSYFHWVITFEATLTRKFLKYVLLGTVLFVLGLVLGDSAMGFFAHLAGLK